MFMNLISKAPLLKKYILLILIIINHQLKFHQHEWIKKLIKYEQQIQNYQMELEDSRLTQDNSKKLNETLMENLNQMSFENKDKQNKSLKDIAERLEKSNKELNEKRQQQNEALLLTQNKNKELNEINNELIIKQKDLQLKYETKNIHNEHRIDELILKNKILEEELMKALSDKQRRTDYDMNKQLENLNQQLEQQRDYHAQEIDNLQIESEKSLKEIKEIYQLEIDMLQAKLGKKNELNNLQQDIDQYIKNNENLKDEKLMNNMQEKLNTQSQEIVKLQSINEKLNQQLLDNQQELQQINFNLTRENQQKRNSLRLLRKIQDLIDYVQKFIQNTISINDVDWQQMKFSNEKLKESQKFSTELQQILDDLVKSLNLYKQRNLSEILIQNSNQRNPLTESQLQTPQLHSIDNISFKKENFLNNDTYMIENDFQNKQINMLETDLIKQDLNKKMEFLQTNLNYGDYKINNNSEYDKLKRLEKRNNKIYSRSIISHDNQYNDQNLHTKSFSRSKNDMVFENKQQNNSHTKLYDQLKLLKNEQLSSIHMKNEILENMKNQKKKFNDIPQNQFKQIQVIRMQEDPKTCTEIKVLHNKFKYSPSNSRKSFNINEYKSHLKSQKSLVEYDYNNKVPRHNMARSFVHQNNEGSKQIRYSPNKLSPYKQTPQSQNYSFLASPTKEQKEKQQLKQILALKKQLMDLFNNNNFQNFQYFSQEQCQKIKEDKCRLEQEFRLLNGILKDQEIQDIDLQDEKRNIKKYLDLLNQDILNKKLNNRLNNHQGSKENNDNFSFNQELKYLVNKLFSVKGQLLDEAGEMQSQYNQQNITINNDHIYAWSERNQDIHQPSFRK